MAELKPFNVYGTPRGMPRARVVTVDLVWARYHYRAVEAARKRNPEYVITSVRFDRSGAVTSVPRQS